MIQVKNKLNQPLAVNIPNEDGIIFLAKEHKEISAEQFKAPEIKNHIELGNIVVLRINDN